MKRRGRAARFGIGVLLAGTLGLAPAPGTALVGPVVVPVDVAGSARLAQVAHTWSANVADYNRDGFQDILLVRHWQQTTVLYRNRGDGTFAPATLFTAGPPDRHDCAWGDVNRDGLLDVYCTAGALSGDAIKANDLFIQSPAGKFTNRAAEFGVLDQLGRGRYTTFIDVNHDGWLDLFVGNDYPREDGQPSPNRLFLNQGGKSFTQATSYGITTEVGANCAQAADFDADGWMDLLVCGNSRLKLYRNVAGTRFEDVAGKRGISPAAWRDAQLVDMNLDGRLDMVMVHRKKFQVQLQRENGRFGAPQGVEPMTDGRKIATGDVNGDRRPDVYVLQGGTEVDFTLVQLGGSTIRFTAVAVPQPLNLNQVPELDPSQLEVDLFMGDGDGVAAINFDRDRRAEFIVLNGRDDVKGPVQLIDYR